MEDDKKAVKSFKDLGLYVDLVEVCNRLRWKAPTEVQTKVIRRVLEGEEDLAVVSQSGTGKTGAFALPILQSLLKTPQSYIACVLSPTSELAIQISDKFKLLGSGIFAMSVALVDGKSHVDESRALGKKPHIVVATPDSLVYHLENTEGFSFCFLKYLVLDEADMLLDEDFKVALNKILKFIPQERRTFLFSATEVEEPQSVCLRNLVKIRVASKYATVDRLKQRYCLLPINQNKDCYLVYILREKPGSTSMVFTSSCEATHLLAFMLRYLGFKAIPISDQMTQEDRLGALKKFEGRDCSVLICTDVASRGLDIPAVDMVIIYDLPANTKNYIHRVGRTARAGRPGMAISLITKNELKWYKDRKTLIGEIVSYPPLNENVLPSLETMNEAERKAHMIKDASTLKQRSLYVTEKQKDCYLVYLLTKNKISGWTSMVFTRTCEATRRLALMLPYLNFSAIPISVEMTQEDRLGALNTFKGGRCNVLICSEAASQGLDITVGDMAIIYDIPANSEDYIQRVCGLARAGRSRRVVSLINKPDLYRYLDIEELIGKDLPRYRARPEDVFPFWELSEKAKKMAQKKARKMDEKKRKGGGDDDEEGDRSVTGKLNKKHKR